MSEDGVSWVEKVHDAFTNSTAEQERTFAETLAGFVRLESLSEVNGNGFTSVAELTVLKNAE